MTLPALPVHRGDDVVEIVPRPGVVRIERHGAAQMVDRLVTCALSLPRSPPTIAPRPVCRKLHAMSPTLAASVLGKRVLSSPRRPFSEINGKDI
jgi:hypothetical protein